MLIRELGIDSEDVSEADLASLCAERVDESQRLEFKRELESGPEANRELARDICAMANGGGGLMVIGIEERADRADSLSAVPLAGLSNRTTQVARSRILPFVPLSVVEVPSEADESIGYALLIVGGSAAGPFATDEGDGLGYWIRSGTVKQPMPEAEVANAYRRRFRAYRGAEERLDELVESIGIRATGSSAVAYVAIVPVAERERVFAPTRSAVAELRGALSDAEERLVVRYGIGEIAYPTFVPGFKRVNNALRWAGDAPGNDAEWQEFHFDGGFLGVIRGDVAQLEFGSGYIPEEITGIAGFYDMTLASILMSRLTAYALFAKRFAISGELAIEVGIRPESPIALSPGQRRVNSETSVPLDRHVRSRITGTCEDLVAPPTLVQVAKTLLDDLVTAFGWPEFFGIDATGAIRLDLWDSVIRADIEHWAVAKDVPIAGEES